jgi:hypothetical protein
MTGVLLHLVYADALFRGYAWSLDTFVDYAWQDLTRLSVTIIVLLIVEVSIKTCTCNAQHRMFAFGYHVCTAATKCG